MTLRGTLSACTRRSRAWSTRSLTAALTGTGYALASSTAPSVALGHTRLAIIDLSDAGSQPMTLTTDNGNTLHITFNGEIYNHADVRRQLDPNGWRSHSDTEVIVRAYARWGPGCLSRLRGMFAFAIWDSHRQELFLARDRLGIKPLYYATTQPGQFTFASEVRALLASGRVARRLDVDGLLGYLTYQSPRLEPASSRACACCRPGVGCASPPTDELRSSATGISSTHLLARRRRRPAARRRLIFCANRSLCIWSATYPWASSSPAV